MTNFVFILADDLGYADLGCYGGRDGRVSPSLDHMAAQGLRFTDGYANSSGCSPTRFALATGRWQYRLRGAVEEPLTGQFRGDKVVGLPPEHPTLASLLRDAGYATALVGKWHLGYPPHFGPLGKPGTRSCRRCRRTRGSSRSTPKPTCPRAERPVADGRRPDAAGRGRVARQR